VAQGCRLLGVLVSGNEEASSRTANDAELVGTLQSCLRDTHDEVSGQAGKVLNSIAHLLNRFE
jgi:hypothetical protein